MTSRTMIMITAGAVVGVVATLLINWFTGRRLGAWLKRVGRRTVIAGFVAAVVSGLLYSVVHEFGHFIFAIALGGTVESVTWTIFGNTEPYVSYGYLPEGVAPWASAGGFLVPTAMGLVLIAAWFLRRRQWSSLIASVLLIPATTLLICNLGCVLELFQQTSHVRRFTSYYGMGKFGEVMVALALAGASLAMLIAVLLALLRNTKSTAKAL